MRKSAWLSLIAPALVLGLSGVASATSNHSSDNLEAVLAGQLPDYDEVRLFKHHRQLFAVGTNDDHSVSIYNANKQGEGWELMDPEADTIADLVANTTAVTGFAVHKKNIYASTVNADGVAEVWRIPTNARPAQWQLVGDAGLGDSTNTAIVDLFQVPGDGLYAITENEAGNGLFLLEDGDWTQVGTYGLGMNVTDAVAASGIRVVGHVVNLATAGGVVYQANTDDLTSWTVVNDFGTEITAMRGRFVATKEDGVVKVYESDAANNYSMVGQADLGNDNNESVVRFVDISRHPKLLVKNSVDGSAYYRYDVEAGAWTAQLEGGFGNSDNTSTTDLLWYRGDRYVATVNMNDGAEIYRLEQ